MRPPRARAVAHRDIRREDPHVAGAVRLAARAAAHAGYKLFGRRTPKVCDHLARVVATNNSTSSGVVANEATSRTSVASRGIGFAVLSVTHG